MADLTPENAKEKIDKFNSSVLAAAKADASAFRAAAEKSARAEADRVKAAALKQAADLADRYEAAIIKIAQGAGGTFSQGLNNFIGQKSLDIDGLEGKTKKESLGKITALKKAARDSLNQGLPQWLAETFKCGQFPHQCDFPKPGNKDPDDGLDNAD